MTASKWARWEGKNPRWHVVAATEKAKSAVKVTLACGRTRGVPVDLTEEPDLLNVCAACQTLADLRAHGEAPLATGKKVVCLCGCVRSDEAVRLRQDRAAAAEAERLLNHAAFERFYADRTAGKPTLSPAEYIAAVRQEA